MHLQFEEPSTVADYFMEKLRHEEQEHVILIALDGKNQLLGEQLISKGTFNASLVTPREVFREALRLQAVGIILLHNHPSGDPSPSLDDIPTTRNLWKAAETTGVAFLDHIIIGDHRYFSFREQDMIKENDI